MRLKNDLHRDHDRKLQEMKEASRRMKDDCDHQAELEKYVCNLVTFIVHIYVNALPFVYLSI